MFAIAVRQPEADLIISGDLRYHPRTWPTQYTGKLYIYAAQTPNLNSKLTEYYANQTAQADGHLGYYIGHVHLSKCVPALPRPTPISFHEHYYLPKDANVWLWTLSFPTKLNHPIPGRGKPFIYVPSPPEIAELNRVEQSQEEPLEVSSQSC